MARVLTVLLLASLFVSCSSDNEHRTNSDNGIDGNGSKMQQVSWMLGSWHMDYPKGILTEVWNQVADSEYAGYSSLVSNTGDTMMRETIRLVNEQGTLWYIPTVSDQNNGAPVRFKETAFSDSMITFENLEHDYPQRIIYKHQSDSVMEAVIEGQITKRTAKEVFLYKKQAAR